MMEDWQKLNFIQTVNFTNKKLTGINKTRRGEFWIKTLTNNKQVYWLADKGSPRRFMNAETALKMLVNNKATVLQPNKAIGEFRCFKNNKIDVTGMIHLDITSGSASAKNCTILLVENNTINILGRDVMERLGLRLSMTKQENKGGKNLLNISNIHQRISKWIFTK